MYKFKYRLLKGLGRRQKNITKDDLAICMEKKFFFIHVPKTAGKSLRLSLFGHEHGARHCSASHLKRCYGSQWNTFFTFCLVRNPYDRLYSAYRYLCSGGNQQKSDRQFLTKELSNTHSFEEFVCGWLNADKAYAYTHFIPQYEFIYQGGICLLDHVGKFENIEQEYSILHARLSLTGTLVHTNSSGSPKRITDYADMYSTEMARQVEKIYADDFRLFNYVRDLGSKGS